MKVRFILREHEEDVSVNLEQEKKKKGLDVLSNSELLKFESIEDIIMLLDELEKCA